MNGMRIQDVNDQKTKIVDGHLEELLPADLHSLRSFEEKSDFYNIHFFPRIDSTNDVAKKLAGEGCSSGTVVIADAQDRGRGRQQREWFSPPGLNIYMTIVLKPEKDLDISHLTLLNLVSSLAVTKALRNTISLQAWSKWPNDICCSNKKLAGILSESVIIEGRLLSVVTGIGVNVNIREDQFPESLRGSATSVYNEKKTSIERGYLIGSILKEFKKYHDLFLKNHRKIIQEWAEISMTINRHVKAITPEETIYGKAVGLNEKGMLQLRLDSGKQVTLHTAEVIHVR